MNINVSFHPYYFPAQKIRKVSHYSTLDKAGGGRTNSEINYRRTLIPVPKQS